MFSNRTIGFYLGLAAGVMAIVSLVAYAMYAVAAGSYNVWVIAPLVLVVLAQAATMDARHRLDGCHPREDAVLRRAKAIAGTRHHIYHSRPHGNGYALLLRLENLK